MPAEAGRGGDAGAQHGGERRLVDLDHQSVDAGQASSYVGDMDAHPLGERLREVATSAVVRQDLVPARPFDRRSEGPRARDLDLERAGQSLSLLLDLVEVLGELTAGTAVVDARRVGQPPPGRLEVGSDAVHDRHRPAGHRGTGATSGQLGQVGRPGSSPNTSLTASA